MIITLNIFFTVWIPFLLFCSIKYRFSDQFDQMKDQFWLSQGGEYISLKLRITAFVLQICRCFCKTILKTLLYKSNLCNRWSAVKSKKYFALNLSLIFTFFFLSDLFLYLANDTVFHPSRIIQNVMDFFFKITCLKMV